MWQREEMAVTAGGAAGTGEENQIIPNIMQQKQMSRRKVRGAERPRLGARDPVPPVNATLRKWLCDNLPISFTASQLYTHPVKFLRMETKYFYSSSSTRCEGIISVTRS